MLTWNRMNVFRLLCRSLVALGFVGTATAQTADTSNAVQQTFRLDVPDSSAFGFMSYLVPVGKRLVINYLAVSATVPSGQRFTTSVQTTLNGTSVDFAQSFVTQNNGDGTDEAVSNQSVQLLADSGTTVYFQVFRRVWRGPFRTTFAFSGQLVPQPPPQPQP